jgi:hypothetical protein
VFSLLYILDSDVPSAKTSRHDHDHHHHHHHQSGPTSRQQQQQQQQRMSRSRSKSPSPSRQSGDGSSLSIHETNKLRIKLGLKPLQIETPSRRQQPPPPPKASSSSRRRDDLEDGEHQDDDEEGGVGVGGEEEEQPEFDEETLRRIREEREKEGETFWKEKKDFVHAPAESLTAKIKSDKLREKLSTMKEKRKMESKLLAGGGLAGGDSDEEDLDAAKWVRKQKEMAAQKALAAKKVRF